MTSSKDLLRRFVESVRGKDRKPDPNDFFPAAGDQAEKARCLSIQSISFPSERNRPEKHEYCWSFKVK
jgi:hypothetical protein